MGSTHRVARRRFAWSVLVVGALASVLSLSACAELITGRPPGVLVGGVFVPDSDRNKEGHFSFRHDLSPPIKPNPNPVDFGIVRVGTDAHRLLVLSNPTRFPVTVVSTMLDTPCFSLGEHVALPLTVPANGSAELTVTFRPPVGGHCSAVLVLDVDSPKGRFLRVRLDGLGASDTTNAVPTVSKT